MNGSEYIYFLKNYFHDKSYFLSRNTVHRQTNQETIGLDDESSSESGTEDLGQDDDAKSDADYEDVSEEDEPGYNDVDVYDLIDEMQDNAGLDDDDAEMEEESDDDEASDADEMASFIDNDLSDDGEDVDYEPEEEAISNTSRSKYPGSYAPNFNPPPDSAGTNDGASSNEDLDGKSNGGLSQGMFFAPCHSSCFCWITNFSFCCYALGKDDRDAEFNSDGDVIGSDDVDNEHEGKDDDDNGSGSGSNASDDDDDIDEEEELHCSTTVKFSAAGLANAAAMHAPGDLFCTIHAPLRSALSGMSHIFVTLKTQHKPWWLNGNLVLSVCSFVFNENEKQQKRPNTKLPSWLLSLNSYDIRSEPHGDNKLYRENDKYTKSVIGFTVILPTAKENHAVKKIQSILAFIRKAMYEYAVDNGGKYALDFIQSSSKTGKDGLPGGLYKALTRNKNDTKTAEDKMKNELMQYFKTKFQVTQDACLDKYLTDIDIKEFLQKNFRVNGWKDVRPEIRKACYKYKWKLANLPVWKNIVREDYYWLNWWILEGLFELDIVIVCASQKTESNDEGMTMIKQLLLF